MSQSNIQTGPPHKSFRPENLHVKRSFPFAQVATDGETTLAGRSSLDPFVAEPTYLEDLDGRGAE